MINIGPAQFGGIIPRVACRSTPDGYAADALNIDFSGERLRGFRTPHKVSDKTGDRLYVDDCCILVGDCNMSWAKPSPLCGRIYRIDNGRLQVATDDGACKDEWCDFGYECEMEAPVIRPVTNLVEDRTLEETYAVYTIVDKWGHESAPSYPSAPIQVNDNMELIVENLPTDYPDKWCAEKIRIYLARSAAQGEAQEESGRVGLFLQAEFDLGPGAVYADFDEPGPELDTEDQAPPPDNLRDLVSWQEEQMAALSGRYLLFSQRRNEVNWSDAMAMVFFDYPLRLIAGRSTAYVLTRGQPAVISLNHDCDQPFCHSAQHVQKDLPLVSMEGAIVVDENAYYPSREGMVRITPNAQAEIISAPWFDRRSWENILPQTMRVGRWGSRLVVMTDEVSFVLDPNAPPNRAMMPIEINAKSFYAAPDGFLYFINDDGVYRWDAGDDYMEWRWSSPNYKTGQYANLYGYKAMIEYPTVNAKVYALEDCSRCGGGDLLADDMLTDCECLTLDAGITAKGFRIELSGKGEVSEIVMAFSPEELYA